MYSYLKDNVVERTRKQSGKETYIANMLIRTLYSNNVSDSESYRIIKTFKDMVLGSDVVIY